MLGEFDLIARYFAPLAAATPGAFGLANDAAVFAPTPGHSVVVTCDAMVEGVHFLPDDPAELIARKLLRVNLSDLAAMGARAGGYVLALALPARLNETWVAAFAEGLQADQAEYGIGLLGGDTVGTPGPLTLALTAFGELPTGNALTRSGAKAGDGVYVSGTIGDGALGLLALRGGLRGLTEKQRAALTERYRLPRPRLALGQALAARRLATAAIDVSDGVVADLAHIATGSGLAAEIRAADVPLSAAARAALHGEPDLRQAILGGGDDYELLFTAPGDRAVDIARLAETLDLPLTRIGALAAGIGVRVVDETGGDIQFPQGGWSHF